MCLHKLSSAFGVGMEWQSGMIFCWIGWPGANFDTTHRTNSPPIIGFNLQHLHGIQFFDNENSFIEWKITYTIYSPFGFAKGGNDLLDCVWVLHQRSAIVFNDNYQSNKAELSIFWDEHLTSKVCVGVIVLEWTQNTFGPFLWLVHQSCFHWLGMTKFQITSNFKNLRAEFQHFGSFFRSIGNHFGIMDDWEFVVKR